MDPVTMAIMAGGSLLGGLGGYLSSNQQAQGQQQGSMASAFMKQQGLQAMQQMYAQAMGNLQPFISGGQGAYGQYTGYLKGGAQGVGGGKDTLISNFAPTVEELQNTPGYQFTLDQGLKTAQNSMAGKGLGLSGNAIKAGVDYAENLANTTWLQQLQAYLQQNAQAANILQGASGLGVNAAGAGAGLAGQGMNAIGNMYGNIGDTIGGGMMGAANARAGGTNALFGGLGSAAMMGGLGYQGYNNPLAGPSTVYGGAGPIGVPTF